MKMKMPKAAKAAREAHLRRLKTLNQTKEGEYARGLADGFLKGWKACGLAILKELKS